MTNFENCFIADPGVKTADKIITLVMEVTLFWIFERHKQHYLNKVRYLDNRYLGITLHLFKSSSR